jgi:ketosteroid isomerase-like protein
MKYLVTALILLLAMPMFAQDISPSLNLDEREKELLNVDAQFSKLSEARGVNEAFLSYLADDCVLLRPNTFPIVGKEINKAKYFSRPDSGYANLETYADIALSGELGLLMEFEFKALDHDGKPIIEMERTFLFGKDQFGNWKLVLDTGNEGLEPKNK